jgi:hypothetical protein
MSITYIHYNTLSELHSAISSKPVCNTGNYDLHSEKNDTSEKWDNNTNYAQAVKLAHEGYKEHANTIQNFLSFQKTSKKRKFKRCFDVAGNQVSIDRYLTCIPECMIAHKRTGKEVTKTVSGKIVKILVNVSASYAITAETIISRGKFIFALCEQLKNNHNKAIQIDVGLFVEKNNTEVYITSTIKNTFELLNPSLLAFYLIHPACLRRVGFRLLEHLPITLRDRLGITDTGSYGSPNNASAKLKQKYDLVFDRIEKNKEYKFEEIEQYIKQVI